MAHYGSRAHATKKTDNQPGKSYTCHSDRRVFGHLLLAGANHLCYILGILLFNHIYNIVNGDSTHKMASLVHHGQHHQVVSSEDIGNFLLVSSLHYSHYLTVHNLGNPLLRSGQDQVSKREGTYQILIFIHHIDIVDFLVFAGSLSYHFNGLFHCSVLADSNKLCRHKTTSSILLVFQQFPYLLGKSAIYSCQHTPGYILWQKGH